MSTATGSTGAISYTTCPRTTATRRHALAEILDDIRTGIITVLVLVHSSRIDRRDPDRAEYYHLSIRMAGGRIESVREPEFGKSDVSGRVITMLAQHANHEYSRALSGHVRAGHDRIRREGGLFGRAPFGYEIQGERYRKTLVPTALGLKYVPEIFARVIRGESLATVAAWLNAEGVPCGTRVARDKRPSGDTGQAAHVDGGDREQDHPEHRL